jgi:predicted DNA-binding protein
MVSAMNMKPTHINLKASQIKQLKAIAKRTGAPVAELVRRGVDQFIQRETEKESTHHGETQVTPGA